MRIGRIVHHRAFAWGVVLFSLVMSISLVHNAWRLNHQPDHSSQETAELEKLQATTDQLKQLIEKEQTPFEKEKIIRDELNMQKDGEIIIQLPALPTPTPKPTVLPSPTPQIFQQWWRAFIGN